MSTSESPPNWMQGGPQQRQPRGRTQQSTSYVKADLRSLHEEERMAASSFPQSVVTGVKIIAWLMLLNTSIAGSFIVVSMFPPRGTETGFGTVIAAEDYFSIGRILISLVMGVIIAIGVWKVVEASD